MTVGTEPCLGPHPCPGDAEIITAREICCPDCWRGLPGQKQFFLWSVRHLPELHATAIHAAWTWLKANTPVPTDVGAELTLQCPGGCIEPAQPDGFQSLRRVRIQAREISCQTCWLRLPPEHRKAVWECWQGTPTGWVDNLAAALTDVSAWFATNPQPLDGVTV